MFSNDCPDEFEFGTKMIETYIQHNILEVQSKIKKQSRSASKKKKQPKYYPGEAAFTLDHSKYDPLDEEFFRRNKIPTKNQFNKAKSNLREAN